MVLKLAELEKPQMYITSVMLCLPSFSNLAACFVGCEDDVLLVLQNLAV